VLITQALGGSYTIATNSGLARITDAMRTRSGWNPPRPKRMNRLRIKAGSRWTRSWCGISCAHVTTGDSREHRRSRAGVRLSHRPAGGAGAKVLVKMTLTGRAAEWGRRSRRRQSKSAQRRGCARCGVDLVWDPPWNQGMISEVGRMKLGWFERRGWRSIQAVISTGA